ncbi:MAG: hypothetical protein JWM80_3071 [Cyanobacteria bacterium RYN_339]|nr:hypothetical protein [Cyanobacteria bacterium RYN_339]
MRYLLPIFAALFVASCAATGVTPQPVASTPAALTPGGGIISGNASAVKDPVSGNKGNPDTGATEAASPSP